ncbi:calcineurin-like phosphoesterase C-terminal domain-containing protein [Cellulophaga baltica]|uniref:calcineurin-like phosphoesterase C-terminal domain-containing protein n=1 Tax=Cellulophaga TaxID=104264 RepID=UPI001C0653E7|nr:MULTISPECIES: calcineurin-like phosphoesterase C-terminal domain-containing protein [Cellulophaga]MBU2997318.1 calcineurin-like phosphoesterase C-terminal domain-containing protein [Cellulophaga baltica]MDO6768716.1 calcineurin-like phosphoesterase C-terminal domain-containing protein [Cellulophaga sp. 1_MG-2023]
MKKAFVITLLLFVQISFGQKVTGTVFLDKNKNGLFDIEEKVLPNILISNGKDIVLTNSKGYYAIKAIPGNLIFLLKPSGYISKLNEFNIVQSYYNFEKENLKKHDFALYEHKENNKAKVALLGDVQVDIVDDVHHVGKLVTEELVDNKPDFIMPLGDLSFDNLEIFDPLSEVLGLIGAPVFYVIGNHDLNFDALLFNDRDVTFESKFGPSYYAFEYGENLFLVLNNITPLPEGKYNAQIDANQLEFIKNLVNLKKDTYKAINLAMHIPFNEIPNKDELIELLHPFDDIFISVGHTHTQFHNYYKRTAEKSDIHELVCGAVCGSWWQGSHDIRGVPFAMMDDGTPKGYWFMEVEGANRKFNYKVSGAPASKQINLWVPEVNEWDTSLNELNEPYVYANVFAADKNTKVEICFENNNWFAMNKFEGVAPELKRFYKLQELGRYKGQNISNIPKPTEVSHHLWRIQIPDGLKKGAHIIKVRATNDKLFLRAKANSVLWK